MTQHSVVLATPLPPDEVLDRLGRTDRFALAARDIVSVAPVGSEEHEYVLRFRGGEARWTQRTEADDHELRFEQSTGDFVSLSGVWEVSSDGSGSRVRYLVAFRTSVPHLAGAIDPVLARVLLRAATDVVDGVAGPATLVESTVPSTREQTPCPPSPRTPPNRPECR